MVRAILPELLTKFSVLIVCGRRESDVGGGIGRDPISSGWSWVGMGMGEQAGLDSDRVNFNKRMPGSARRSSEDTGTW